MSDWTPEWKLTLDGGLDYTNLTLSNVTITAGRTNIYVQPQASYASFQVLNLDQSSFPVGVNDSVTISLKDSTGTYVPIFGGFITDLSQVVQSAGAGGITQTFNIIALGALARLPKALTEGVLAKAGDGTQIYTILEQVLFNRWNQVPAAETWSAYDPTTTWANAENNGLGEIDQPGDYDLDARASSVTNVYNLVAQLANSGLGYLYEDAQGRICYADSTHRAEYLASNSFIDISANTAYAAGIKTITKTGDVRNSVTIKYKANQSQEVSASDAASIAQYGELAQVISTTLDKTADATTQANYYLALRAYPQAQFDSITFPLANPEIDDSDRDNLINIFMGMPIKITDLPANMNDSQFEGFVEGWTFRAGYNSLSLTLNLSPAAYSIQSMRWNGVGATELWTTITPTLDWEQATIVSQKEKYGNDN